MTITREELAAIGAVPKRVIINPEYLQKLRVEAAPFPGWGHGLDGLEVVENGYVRTYAIEYTDGTFHIPENEEPTE